jgi:hypothetical protein
MVPNDKNKAKRSISTLLPDDVSLRAIVMAQLPLTRGLSEFTPTFQGLVKGIDLHDISCGIAKFQRNFTSGISQLKAFEEVWVNSPTAVRDGLMSISISCEFQTS